MRRLTTLASMLTGAIIAVSAVAQVQAAGGGFVTASLENGQSIFRNGKGDVPACMSCHEEDAMGNDNLGTPRLAGQVVEFIVKQLEDFATDRRAGIGAGVVMPIFAKQLTSEDRRDVAAYVSSLAHDPKISATGSSNLKALREAGVTVGDPAQGLRIVSFGVSERDIPACRSCHDYNGRGVEPIYPMIGQQKYVYLVNQLTNWRDGSRNNDPLEQMQKVARKMTDEDIHNAAAFLTGASPYTLGNYRRPERHVSVRGK
ncbi:MAG: c-type cytochrome [Chromatiales bacterium]|jgi:cytochrome c553|nr:c-type cytochrome [Chromatiales bacterium]